MLLYNNVQRIELLKHFQLDSVNDFAIQMLNHASLGQ